MKNRMKEQSGGSDVGIIMTVLGGAIVISVIYFTIKFIISIKEARMRGANTEEQAPPPKSVEEMGGYEVTY